MNDQTLVDATDHMPVEEMAQRLVPRSRASIRPVVESTAVERLTDHERRAVRARLLEAFSMQTMSARGHFSIGREDIRRLELAEQAIFDIRSDNAEAMPKEVA